MKILYLFPDTNLFIQCRSLEHIDWSEIGEFDEIQLFVSQPVQKEIDAQKNKGNQRLGKRARKTAAFFKDILTSNTKRHIIKDARPRVTISVILKANL